MKKIIICLTILSIAGCIFSNRKLIIKPEVIEPDIIMDSLKNQYINNDYIYYYRSISTFNRNHYFIVMDSVKTLFKVNVSARKKYSSNYWQINSSTYLNNNFIELLNDSVIVGNEFIEHSPNFTIEFWIHGHKVKKTGFYYQLKSEQPINRFINILEQDLLNAEQDDFFWYRF